MLISEIFRNVEIDYNSGSFAASENTHNIKENREIQVVPSVLLKVPSRDKGDFSSTAAALAVNYKYRTATCGKVHFWDAFFGVVFWSKRSG